MQVLKEDIRDRILAISLEHFRENYTDRSMEVVKAWFASMQQKHPEINTAVSDFIIHLHCIRFPNRKWKPSCTTIFFLKFKAGGQSSKYEIQATYIRTFNRIRTVGREEIFTEVSFFFIYRAMIWDEFL